MSFTTGLRHARQGEEGSCPCKHQRLGESIWYSVQQNDAVALQARLKKYDNKKDLFNLRDAYGYTPVHYAAQKDHVEVLRILLANGADPDGRVHRDSPAESSRAPSSTEEGRACRATPLHRAAYAGALRSCRLLVEAGAALDLPDLSFGDRRTALMKAASRGHLELTSLLLTHGADGSLEDASGLTYSDLLLQAGAGHQVHSDAQVGREGERGGEDCSVTGELRSRGTAGVPCSKCFARSLSGRKLAGRFFCLTCARDCEA